MSSGRPFILREYQNLPVDRAMAWFDMDEAITFETQRYGFLRSDDRFVSWEELSGATIFLGLGGRSLKLGNKTATLRSLHGASGSPCPNGGMYDGLHDSRRRMVTCIRRSCLEGRAYSNLTRISNEYVRRPRRSWLMRRQSRPDFYLQLRGSFVDTTGRHETELRDGV